MTKNERVLKIAADAGLNNSEFASRMGISKQYFSQIKNMKRNINDKYLVRIIETFADVDARWLITGKYGKEDYEAEYRQKYLEIEKTFLEKLEILEKSHKALIKAKDATIHDKEYIISMKDEIINFLKQ